MSFTREPKGLSSFTREPKGFLVNYLLNEDGSFILQENGGLIVLDGRLTSGFSRIAKGVTV